MAIKITYFDATGRAEATRLAFTIGGIKFEDERINGEQFMAMRDKTPFGSLPVMEVRRACANSIDALQK